MLPPGRGLASRQVARGHGEAGACGWGAGCVPSRRSVTLTVPSPQAGAGEGTLLPASAAPGSQGGRGFSPWQPAPPCNASQTGRHGPARDPPGPAPACLPPPARPGLAHLPCQPRAPRVGHGWTLRCRDHHRWVSLGTGVRGVRSQGSSGMVLCPVPIEWPELSRRPGIPQVPHAGIPGLLSPEPLGRAERGQEMAAGPCPQKAGGRGGSRGQLGRGVPVCHPVGWNPSPQTSGHGDGPS